MTTANYIESMDDVSIYGHLTLEEAAELYCDEVHGCNCYVNKKCVDGGCHAFKQFIIDSEIK